MNLSLVLQGYSVIGAVASPTAANIQEVSMAITGLFDDAIRAAAQHRLGCELDDPRVALFLDTVKSRAKYIVQQIFNMAEREEEADQKREREERMRSLSKPHAAGTTAEIAEMLKLSKAQVRKHKAEGTLDGLLAAHQLEIS